MKKTLQAAAALPRLRLLALDGHLATAETKTLRIPYTAVRLARSGRQRNLKIQACWPRGRRHRDRLEPDQYPTPGP